MKASSIELEQFNIQNLISEDKLEIAEKDAPEELVELIEVAGEVI